MEKSAADRKVIQDTLSEHYVFSDLAAKTISDVVDGVCLFQLIKHHVVLTCLSLGLAPLVAFAKCSRPSLVT